MTRQEPSHADAVRVDDALLRDWPLPGPPEGGKEARGCVLVVAGSPEIAGAARLTAEATLRAGAGKLVVATAATVAPHLSLAVPEARVIALPPTPAGGFAMAALDLLRETAGSAHALVIGPGMQDETATRALAAALLGTTHGSCVLDAYAMGAVLADRPPPVTAAVHPALVVTPHAGEMAHLTGQDKDAITADPAPAARAAARAWQAVVVLKGPVTWIAAPDGRLWRHEGGNAGLGVSGSGDVLAGIVGGLAARGVPVEQAAVWGVRLHARAGERLAAQFGTVGYLAREIAREVPAMMEMLLPRAKDRIGFQ